MFQQTINQSINQSINVSTINQSNIWINEVNWCEMIDKIESWELKKKKRRQTQVLNSNKEDTRIIKCSLLNLFHFIIRILFNELMSSQNIPIFSPTLKFCCNVLFEV
jgi:hypothetical protein